MVWALCYQLRFRSGLIPVCIFFQSRASSQLQGFNLLLLWLQETMFFFFGHTAFMHHFALCFCLHLCLYASSHLSSPPRKEQVKTKSAQGSLAHLGQERGRCCRCNWDMPAVAETCRKLLQSKMCCALFQGNFLQVASPSGMLDCTGSQESVGSDLCLLTAWWHL